jgi:hypothetical protein
VVTKLYNQRLRERPHPHSEASRDPVAIVLNLMLGGAAQDQVGAIPRRQLPKTQDGFSEVFDQVDAVG